LEGWNGKKRNWKEYNEELVKRGEIFISIDFIKNWKKRA